ncbi:senescence-associated gene 21, mitochondrial-like protein [Tanacetum coccineum]
MNWFGGKLFMRIWFVDFGWFGVFHEEDEPLDILLSCNIPPDNDIPFLYAFAAEVKEHTRLLQKKKVIDGIQDEKPEKKEVFWMRHPKTGYYMPETHFDDVDVADTNKILSDKPKP